MIIRRPFPLFLALPVLAMLVLTACQGRWPGNGYRITTPKVALRDPTLPSGWAASAPLPVAPVPATQASLWLYGTAESAALTQQVYRQLADYVRVEVATLRSGVDYASALLVPGATTPQAVWRRCTPETAARPAVVFDLDETLLANRGYQAAAVAQGGAFNPRLWGAWEADADGVEAMPGAVALVQQLRTWGITPLFNSNRTRRNAPALAVALTRLGFGETRLDDTLYLLDERLQEAASNKDPRRAQIAKRYCVLAMAGDQLGDFSQGLTLARAGRSAEAGLTAVAAQAVPTRWGRGWFMLANPVYGDWMRAAPLDNPAAVLGHWRPKIIVLKP